MLLLLTSCSSTPHSSSTSETAKFAFNGKKWSKSTTDFIFLESATIDSQDILLKKTINSSYTLGHESTSGTLNLTAYVSNHKAFDTKIWEISDNYDTGHLSSYDSFFVTSKSSGSAPTSINVYSIVNGKKLFTYNPNYGDDHFDITCISLPHRPYSRYFGHLSNGSYPFPKFQKSKKGYAAGILSYSSKQAIIQKVLIRIKSNTDLTNGGSDLGIWSPDLFVSKVGASNGKLKKRWFSNECSTIWENKDKPLPQALSGYSIMLNGSKWKIIIPVINDRLDLRNAIVPAGFSLESISLK